MRCLIPSRLAPALPNGLDAELQVYQTYQAFKPKLSSWETLFDMQHYFVPTRLLDWTTDLATALYFALNSEDCTYPSIYILLPCILNFKAGQRGDPQPVLLGASGTYRYPTDYTPYCSHELPLAVMPAIINDRIRAQNGMFTIHGGNPAPIERLCSEALGKIVLRIGRPALDQFRRLGRKARDVFPDETGMAITLREQFGLKPIPEKLIERILLRVWHEDDKNLQAGNHGKVHVQGISGCLVDSRYIERTEALKMLKNWLANDSSRFAVVTGGAASGKTNFLVNLVLNGKFYKDHPVLYISLNGFRPGERSLIGVLADFLRDHSPDEYEPIDERTLESMIRAGRLLLILDGLDELARIQGEGSVIKLGAEISSLATGGAGRAKIIVACRDHIVNRLEEREILPRLPERALIGLEPIPPGLLKARLAVALPTTEITGEALDILGEVPLFYGVLMQRAGSSVSRAKIERKADLWNIWLDMASESWKPAPDRGQLLNKLGAIAALMLKERDDYLGDNDLKNWPELIALMDHLASRKIGHCPVFVHESNGKSRFIHQAIREYVLAKNIHFGLHHPHAPNVLTMSASLDYESAETYRYLQDLLPNRRIPINLLPDRDKMDPAKWNNFARNYFEALGMLGVDSEAEAELDTAIAQALDAIQAGPIVRYKTKYNAARCLERLHPTSYNPYCEWAARSKWPELDQEGYRVVYGYAVRGFHQRRLKLGKTPPEVFFGDLVCHPKSSMVCDILLESIAVLSEIPELHQEGEFFQVNCSHALIRWFDPTSADLLRRLNHLMRSSKVLRETRMNLFLTLCIRGQSELSDEEVLLPGKDKWHFDGDINKLCGPEYDQ